MQATQERNKTWMESVIKQDQVDKYLRNGKDFIDEEAIHITLKAHRNPEKQAVRDILQKSLAIERLEPRETAMLLNVEDPELSESWPERAVSPTGPGGTR